MSTTCSNKVNNVSESSLDRKPSQFAEYELLLKILNVCLSYKYRIFFVSLIGAAAVAGLSMLLEDRYTASAVVALNLNDKRGGVSPDSYRGNSTINVLEFDLIVDQASSDEKDRHLARLKSFDFLSGFIIKNNLLPMIFRSKWSDNSQGWIEDFHPDIRDAVNAFRGDFLSIGKYGKTEMISVSVTSHSASLSAELADKISSAYNIYNRDRELGILAGRKEYLEKRLEEVSNKETQLSIYRLLESQLAVESLLFARKNYPMELIRPAMPPKFKTYPKRKIWVAAAFIGLIFISIFSVFALSMIRALSRDLKSLSFTNKTNSNQENEVNDSDWVDDPSIIQDSKGGRNE